MEKGFSVASCHGRKIFERFYNDGFSAFDLFKTPRKMSLVFPPLVRRRNNAGIVRNPVVVTQKPLVGCYHDFRLVRRLIRVCQPQDIRLISRFLPQCRSIQAKTFAQQTLCSLDGGIHLIHWQVNETGRHRAHQRLEPSVRFNFIHENLVQAIHRPHFCDERKRSFHNASLEARLIRRHFKQRVDSPNHRRPHTDIRSTFHFTSAQHSESAAQRHKKYPAFSRS